jgi:hypothetical protein
MYRTDLISPRKNIVFCPAGWLRARKICIYFGGAGLKNGDFWRILEPVRHKSLCGVGVKLYISRVRGWCGSVKLKYFFWSADWTQVCTVCVKQTQIRKALSHCHIRTALSNLYSIVTLSHCHNCCIVRFVQHCHIVTCVQHCHICTALSHCHICHIVHLYNIVALSHCLPSMASESWHPLWSGQLNLGGAKIRQALSVFHILKRNPLWWQRLSRYSNFPEILSYARKSPQPTHTRAHIHTHACM